MTIKTRFAPSPTGYLHIGGARTALYSWLLAKKLGGKFVLRIEDSDRERSTDASVQAILDGMEWLGLDYDEGPIYQTARLERYQEVINQLLAEEKAYKCYCSKERLGSLREEQIKQKLKPRYDGHCLEYASEEEEGAAFVVRFKNPRAGTVTFKDLVYGEINVKNDELDDVIIQRSDGTPTYNFSVVVDDMDMAISHVVRGDDHISNTPRQVNILAALGVTPPIYAHLPMILGEDGKRLSKRHGAASVMDYKKQGILPHAMLNYLVRLGWSHGDQEIFSRDEMQALFDLEHVHRAPAAINPEKLLWMNQHYMKTFPPEELLDALTWQCGQAGLDVAEGPDLKTLISAQAERCKTLHEIVEKSRYFFEDFREYDEKAARKNLKVEAIDILETVLRRAESLDDWRAQPLHQIIIDIAESQGLKLGKVAQPIRVAVTGGMVSPPLDVTLEMLGKQKVCQRLQHALEFIASQAIV